MRLTLFIGPLAFALGSLNSCTQIADVDWSKIPNDAAGDGSSGAAGDSGAGATAVVGDVDNPSMGGGGGGGEVSASGGGAEL